MKTYLPILLLVSLVPLSFLSGCSGPTGTVSGKVTAVHPTTGKKAPVAMGRIGFFSEQHNKTVFGVINPDGKFLVKDIPAGEVKVIVQSEQPEVTKSDPADDPPPFKVDPKKWFPLHGDYATFARTTLKYEVKPGEQTKDFHLAMAWKNEDE